MVPRLQVRHQTPPDRPRVVPPGADGRNVPIQEHPPRGSDAKEHSLLDHPLPLLRRARHPRGDDRCRPRDRQLRRLLHRLHEERRREGLRHQNRRRRLCHPRELQAPRRDQCLRTHQHRELRRLELLPGGPLRRRHRNDPRRLGRQLPLPRVGRRHLLHPGVARRGEERLHREHPRP